LRSLLALLLVLSLGAASAHAGEPACEPAIEASAATEPGHEAGHAPGHDDPPADDGCGDCGEGCDDCTCCRAPLAVATAAERPARPGSHAQLACERAPLEGVRPPSDIFQPPRA
jgi:hypothetical protein